MRSVFGLCVGTNGAAHQQSDCSSVAFLQWGSRFPHPLPGASYQSLSDRSASSHLTSCLLAAQFSHLMPFGSSMLRSQLMPFGSSMLKTQLVPRGPRVVGSSMFSSRALELPAHASWQLSSQTSCLVAAPCSELGSCLLAARCSEVSSCLLAARCSELGSCLLGSSMFKHSESCCFYQLNLAFHPQF